MPLSVLDGSSRAQEQRALQEGASYLGRLGSSAAVMGAAVDIFIGELGWLGVRVRVRVGLGAGRGCLAAVC